MTIGVENFGNGSAKPDDRFAGQLSGYRAGGRRDSSAVLPIEGAGEELGARNGSVPTLDRITTPLDTANPIGSSLTAPQLAESELDDLGLGESGFSTEHWLDSPSTALADHPLLRGLLLELPPKGSVPPQVWLDRWFEAARSILELLYAREATPRS